MHCYQCVLSAATISFHLLSNLKINRIRGKKEDMFYLQLKWLDSCPLDLHRERCVLLLLHTNGILSTIQADYIC